MPEVSLAVAFVAGALSISSPCVLPLVPLYLAHLSGATMGEPGTSRGLVMRHATAFVVGFGVVFVLIGVSLGALGGVFIAYRPWLIRFGGVFMVATGLQMLGLIRLPWLGQTHRLSTGERQPGRISSSFLIGVSFAAGWMPCVGPILGAIFTLAVSAAAPARSGLLLGVYAAGLAVPFLTAALFLGSLNRRLVSVGGLFARACGGVMMVVGAFMLLGIYQQFFARVVASAPWTPWEPSL